MKVSTILGIPYLHMEEDNDYHLCLAHLLANKTYQDFFKQKSRRGDMVMMDNGVVETGLPMEWSLLNELAYEVEAVELVLPDRLCNKDATLQSGKSALRSWNGDHDLIAVPQGRSLEEWRECLLEMLNWPVETIGISKFVKPFASSRVGVLEAVPELIESTKSIHVLGCLSISDEAINLEKRFPGRIRGIDSGIAAICTQAGIRVSDFDNTGGRLDVPLDFFARNLDENLLAENVFWWRQMCGKP